MSNNGNDEAGEKGRKGKEGTGKKIRDWNPEGAGGGGGGSDLIWRTAAATAAVARIDPTGGAQHLPPVLIFCSRLPHSFARRRRRRTVLLSFSAHLFWVSLPLPF